MAGGKRDGAGRPKCDEALVRKTVFLPKDTIEKGKKLGLGSLRDGIVEAVRRA